MKCRLIDTVAAALVLVGPTTGLAQHTKNIKLHVNTRWSDCAFQLDSSLTQGAWRQFTREAGLVTYLRPLADARPMGAGKLELSVLQWSTGIDDADAAWNDTFVHPDSTHWLMDGSSLALPGLMLRAGLTGRLDVGAYFSKNPSSNYGLYGGLAQYNVVRDTTAGWAASARLSFASLYGPTDLRLTVYGLDLLASRTFAAFSWASITPYAGVSAYLSRSKETTAVVNLTDENVLGAQAMVGAVVQHSWARLAVEFNLARVPSRSIKLGVAF